jgi:hypothetical protein
MSDSHMPVVVRSVPIETVAISITVCSATVSDGALEDESDRVRRHGLELDVGPYSALKNRRNVLVGEVRKVLADIIFDSENVLSSLVLMVVDIKVAGREIYELENDSGSDALEQEQ